MPARMKKLFSILAISAMSVMALAQGGNTGTGGSDGNYESLAARVLNLEKKTEGFNLFLNYAASYQMSESDGDWTSAFRAKQLRLEIKGQFGEHLSYRLRHRLNRSNVAMSEENFAKATDIMMLGWKFNDKFTLMAGKMCQFWGGFEFDENPMYIYQYSDMLDCLDNFLPGVALSVTPVPNQEFVLNVTNSYSGKFASEYGEGAVTAAGNLLQASDHPLSYIFNWNGNFADGMFATRWAVGTYTQAKNYRANMVYLGQCLTLPKFQWYFDYMGSFEGLDRLRIATGELGGVGYQTHVRYNSFVTKMRFDLGDGFQLMLKGMYETTGTKDLGKFRTALGYVGSLEYYPLKDQDLRFFAAYIGRHFGYDKVNLPDYSTNRIEIGFMYRIKAY